MKIVKTGAFSPEMLLDDFAKMVKAVDDNPSSYKDNSGLIYELEKVIENSQTVHSLESRLTALEERLSAISKPAFEYPTDTVDTDNYTAEVEPEYGMIPFYNKVAAGSPIDQSEDQGMVVRVPMRFIKTKLSDYYAIRVHGNSMIDALIPDGSMVLIRKSDVPQHGKIQLVRIDGQATLKRMRQGEDHNWTLCHEDGTGQTVPLGDDNMIQGDFAAVLPPNTKPYMRKD